MALFGRRKTKQLSDDELLLDEEGTVAVRPEPAEGEPGVDRDWVRAEDGPYDITEWPEVDGGIDLALSALGTVNDDQLSAGGVGLATVDVETEQFRMLDDDEVEGYLDELELLESEDDDEQEE